ncbi:MAG: hypothetical protein WC387_04070 [Candidatus Paceibacterota bacterium]|jgi:hypothetical protein
MKRIIYVLKKILIISLCLGIIGCVTVPTGFLRPTDDYLEKRQLQIRQYDTKDQERIITSVAGVLQDLGFTLGDSETEVGFVAASKKADAVNKGQVALMIFLGGLGNNPQAVQQCDKEQVIRASVITKPSLDGSKTIVRVTFQRIVWNMANQVSRVETLKDPEIYQKFYDSLSKAIFLEAQQI